MNPQGGYPWIFDGATTIEIGDGCRRSTDGRNIHKTAVPFWSLERGD